MLRRRSASDERFRWRLSQSQSNGGTALRCRRPGRDDELNLHVQTHSPHPPQNTLPLSHVTNPPSRGRSNSSTTDAHGLQKNVRQ